jgi:hypothetical protein
MTDARKKQLVVVIIDASKRNAPLQTVALQFNTDLETRNSFAMVVVIRAQKREPSKG